MSVDPLLRYQGDFAPVLQTDIDLAAVRVGPTSVTCSAASTVERRCVNLPARDEPDDDRARADPAGSARRDRPPGGRRSGDNETASLSQEQTPENPQAAGTGVARRVAVRADLIGVGRYGDAISARREEAAIFRWRCAKS